MVFYIALVGITIACIGSIGACMQIPPSDLGKLVAAGTVELIFEIVGVIKIFKSK